jgi:hypothetical protein
MRSLILAFLITVAVCSGIFASFNRHSAAGAHTLTVVNNSSVDITRMYVAWSKTGRWGADLLGKGVLRPGSSFPISLAAGEYDLMLVDSRNRSCVLRTIAVYSDKSWSFDDNWLSRCPQ